MVECFVMTMPTSLQASRKAFSCLVMPGVYAHERNSATARNALDARSAVGYKVRKR